MSIAGMTDTTGYGWSAPDAGVTTQPWDVMTDHSINPAFVLLPKHEPPTIYEDITLDMSFPS